MERPALSLLLALFVGYSGFCEGLSIPKISVPKANPGFDIAAPLPGRPDPVPGIVPGAVPHIPSIPAANPPDGAFPLGRYSEDGFEAPFADLDGEWGQYFSQVDDILEAVGTKPAADGPNGGAIPKGAPPTTLSTGNTYTITKSCSSVDSNECGPLSAYTTVWDPTEPMNACSAWSSLSAYCGGGGTRCACYSSSYYVPDQWNLLAAACANASSAGCTAESRPTSSGLGLSWDPNVFSPFPTLSPLPTPFSLPEPIPTFIAPEIFHPPRDVSSTTAMAEESASWCDLISRASSYASYCPTDLSTVAFGAITTAPEISPSDDSESTATAMGVVMFRLLAAETSLVLSILLCW